MTVKYSVAIGRNIYSVFKKPRCSLACCLSFVLTLNEVQSEARDLAGKSSGWRIKAQLKRGIESEGN